MECVSGCGRRRRRHCRRCIGGRGMRASGRKGSGGYYDAYYRKAQQVRTLLTRDFLTAFAEVDVLVTPVTPTPAFKLGEKTDDPVKMYLEDIYSVAASLAGICGASVPCGTTREGLAIGVQVMGKHFDEGTMLRVAQAVETGQKSR